MGHSSSTSETRDELKPLMKSLSENAASFIDLYDSHRRRIKPRVENCQILSKEVTVSGSIRSRVWFGILYFMLLLYVLASSPGPIAFETFRPLEKQVESLLDMVGALSLLTVVPFILLIIYAFALTHQNKSNVEWFNQCIREFRKSVFSLAVELGKLKQCCRELKQGLRSGLEKVNVQRLEESVEELLCQMENLTDSVTQTNMDDVRKEYEAMLHELDKMKVRVSFYRGTSDGENSEPCDD